MTQATNPFALLRERLSPYYVPNELKQLPPSLAVQLPYEQVLTKLDHPTVLLQDGGIGVAWELRPLEHEMMPNELLLERCDQLAVSLSRLRERDLVMQLIFQAEPAWDIPWRDEPPRTALQKLVAARIEHMEALARGGKKIGRSPFRTLRRRCFLTLRADGLRRDRTMSDMLAKLLLGREESEAEAQRAFAGQLRRLADQALEVEDNLAALDFDPKRCDADTILELLRWPWHDEGTRQNQPAVHRPYNPSVRLGNQISRDFVRQHRAGLQTGRDTWQMVSWVEQPQAISMALWTMLLEISVPFRATLSLRPCHETRDLELAATQLKVPFPGGARRIRHLQELAEVDQAQVHGEQISWASLNLIVKNEGLSLEDLEHHGVGRQVAHVLGNSTGIDFVVEQEAMPGLFLLTQPFTHSRGTAYFLGRERRVLTSSLAAYLPIFGGFSGSSAEPHHRVLPMHSRAGDPCWLDVRASPTAPHAAVLASTGAGKSFFLAQLLQSELAAHPDAMVFVVDSLASYEVLGQVVGETGGYAHVRPPDSSPNLWEGELTNERLSVLVGLLRTAIGLIKPGVSLGPEHDQLLEASITQAFDDRSLAAETTFDEGSSSMFGALDRTGARRLPRLSDVVGNFAAVAAEQGLPKSLAPELTLMLQAFVGDGRYAGFFDEIRDAEPEAPTPQFTLFDLGRVEDDILRALNLSACVAEVVRHVMRPENRGRPGVLLVDEAGVLLRLPGESGQALVEFVQRAWKTFRKLGVSCIGSTNEPSDYIQLAGPRTIWANSPTKILLRLKQDDLRIARMGDPAASSPPLFEDPLVADVAGSLRKVDGLGGYSQGLWWGEEGRRGTFTYVAAGADYWVAASKPQELDNFALVRGAFDEAGADKPASEALQWLATHFPGGVRDENGRVRALTRSEVQL